MSERFNEIAIAECQEWNEEAYSWSNAFWNMSSNELMDFEMDEQLEQQWGRKR